MVDIARLRSLRESRGISQAKIAELLDVSPAAYSTYEVGTRDMGSDKIVKLAKYYNVTTDYIYGIENSTDSEFSQSEKTHIKKYRTLDEYGKKAVDNILDVEYERCIANKPQQFEMLKVARSADNHGPTIEVIDKSVVDYLESVPGIENDDDL